MFPRRISFTRSGVTALTKLLLALAFLFAVHYKAEAAGTLISAPNRVDMVYDSARDTLYITSGASVLRYQLSTNSFLTPFNLGGSLAGLDLSPDGNTLVVADRTRDTSNIWVYVIDLRTGAANKATTPRTSGEGGTFTVAFGADNKVLVTSTYEGSGWVPLRRLDPATGAWTSLTNLFPDMPGGTITQNTMLAASGDRSVIGFAEGNISDGRWGSYSVTNGTVAHRTGYTDGTSWFNYEIGVNKNGTQYALPTYGGTFVYNSTFAKSATVGVYAGAQPVGVAYHPVEDIVYFPWATTQEVRAFDTNTFAQIAAYNFQENFTTPGNQSFRSGRMKISRDGSLIFCSVTGGVRYLRLYAPLAAGDQSVTTVENTPVNVTLSGSVGNNGSLSYRVATQPAHGTVTVNGSNAVYTPATNYEGADSFTFKSVYGPAESAPATVNVTVTHGDAVPAADDQTITVDEDGSVAITLTGTDPDGSPLTYTVVNQPAHGTLTGTAPNLVYTPAANYSGSDNFTFNVSDGTTNSSPAGVYLTVNGVNDPPSATDQSLATDEDTPLSITLAGTDVDNSSLAFNVFAQPAHGTLSGTGANLTYTPAPNYNGADSFGFKASDGSAESNGATVTIDVRSVNDVPAVTGQSIATNEDTPAAVTLSASDADGDALNYTFVTQPAHGTLTGTAPNLVYTPAANYYGPDSFTFKVSDGAANSPTATVSISVASVNDAPASRSQSLLTYEDSAFSFYLYGSDVEYDPLTFTVVSQPTHGKLTGTAPGLTYTPDPNFNGTDSFTYKINDGTADSDVATISIEIRPVNDPPVANAQTVNVDEDTSAPVTLSATDIEDDQFGYEITVYPQHGVLSGTIPNLAYKANANYNGPDSFTYRAYDGKAWSATVTVTINVAPVNDPPVANSQSVGLGEDSSAPITLSGSDVEGDALSYAVVAAPAHGTLSGTAPNLVYTPAPNYNGPDSFTFMTSDGRLSSAPAIVYLNVNAANDAPVANSQTVATNEDTSKAITLTASDVDGDALTYYLVGVPQHGALTGTLPNLTYTPAADYNGTDSFTFVVNDGKVQSAVATVTINVAAVNDAPVAVADTKTVAKNSSAVNITALANDRDVDGDALTITSVTQSPNGTITIASGGKSVNYTPKHNYRGNDVFSYTINDGHGRTATASVTVTVQ